MTIFASPVDATYRSSPMRSAATHVVPDDCLSRPRASKSASSESAFAYASTMHWMRSGSLSLSSALLSSSRTRLTT